MTHAWRRCIASGTAGQNSADTTETEIGSGIEVPNWAKSVLAVMVQLDLITQTTAENVSGYAKLTNDVNSIDPLNFPLEVIPANLAGAAAGQMSKRSIMFPAFSPVEGNDTVHVKFALDIATTGVHVVDGYVLFSSENVPFQLHAEKTALTAGGDALTDSTSVDISTLVKRTKDLLAIWGYVVSTATAAAAETVAGHVKITSLAEGWQEQHLPLNKENACLGADSYIITAPVVYTMLQEEVLGRKFADWFKGIDENYLSPRPFPIGGVKQTFTCKWYNDRDIADTIDPQYRIGLVWRE